MNEKSLRVLEYAKIKNMVREYCVSNHAKKTVDELMPSTEVEDVVNWQAETTEASRVLLKSSNIHMGRIGELEEYLKIASIGSTLFNRSLLEIGDTLRTARLLKKYIERQPDETLDIPVLLGYSGQMYEFKTIEEAIERCIISDTEMSDNASAKLRQIRKSIDSKHAQIRSRLDKIVSSDSMQKYLQDALVTIRQDRFVIPVKSEHKSHIKGLVHDQSASGATFYIEPMEIVELNNQLRELGIDEQREIERILLELTGMVAEHVDAIRSTYEALVHLDFVFAKAKLSVKMRAVEPVLSETPYIRIKNGKHPLIPSDEVVPTNFYLGDSFESLLITGPNTGGKTVTIKTVGLFSLMYQSGLHVPADHGTTMPILSAVYADIGDEQSIEQSLSTFSSHMTNIVDILDHVSPNCLVLFDELGAGTDPTEGAALAMAILKYVKACGALSVATTHYSELKQFALTNEGFENASVEFDVETLSPTYRLLIGVPGKSNAFEISRKLGLNHHIIESAGHFIDNDSIEFEEILHAIEENRKASESDRDTAIRLRMDAEKLKERMEKAEHKIRDQRDKVLREAKLEAKGLLKAAKDEADTLVKEIRSMKSATNIDNKRLDEIRKNLKSKSDQMNTGLMIGDQMNGDVPDSFKLGQSVMVTTLGQKGAIVELPDDKNMVQVQVGIMRMSVKVDDLRTIEEPKAAIKKSIYSPAKGKAKGERAIKSTSIRNEVDLRGQNLDEAMMALDKYLDNAMLSSLEQVTVIHGVGTGVLKKGLTEFMRKHPHVKSQRPGAYGEGGAGVTIVELK
ncbi:MULTISPECIES: endonuclease MutS2 [unclassified Fusibacter]|uniref:endonuclease MutS2 n=1 Tax=unclassified Fusibacter TaxID=2624464 RepID=UPI001010ED49|nr:MULTISPECIES: endonuclease MutS2 [unclassified Fusibacter]MCK8058713.1 endonuclease MutS2 [Fusibacter sp. A2]NPE21787.1 endonuclease MutS2 [Fusibacter sp. A1]RXV61360.1 endonuclease MutS2 [Fusibacter sp. A1]